MRGWPESNWPLADWLLKDRSRKSHFPPNRSWRDSPYAILLRASRNRSNRIPANRRRKDQTGPTLSSPNLRRARLCQPICDLTNRSLGDRWMARTIVCCRHCIRAGFILRVHDDFLAGCLPGVFRLAGCRAVLLGAASVVLRFSTRSGSAPISITRARACAYTSSSSFWKP